MASRRVVTLLTTFVLVAAALVASDVPTAAAQDDKVPQEKGVSEKPLATSLGTFNGAASIPLVLNGKVMEIAPGGQTGLIRHNVPDFVFVLQGTLTTDTKGGPVGTAGIQYTTAGQAYSDPPGVWHNYMNNGTTPVKYILLLISTPSQTLTEKAKPSND